MEWIVRLDQVICVPSSTVTSEDETMVIGPGFFDERCSDVFGFQGALEVSS